MYSFAVLNPRAGVMSRMALGRQTDESMLHIKAKLKEVFVKQQYIYLTADIRSSRNRSFLEITAHWVSSYFHLPVLCIALFFH